MNPSVLPGHVEPKAATKNVAEWKEYGKVKHVLRTLLIFWVMWHEEYSNFKRVWKPGDFFESKNQCRAAILELIELREKEAKRKNPSSTFIKFQVPETGLLGYYGSKITDETQTFTCLPEGRKPAD